MSVVSVNEKPTRLIQLPNNDLWRGRVQEEIIERPDTVDASAPATPEDAVIEMLQSQKGQEVITCVWCAQQFNRKEFNELKAHVETLHPTALKPLNSEESMAAMIDLKNAMIVGKVVLDD